MLIYASTYGTEYKFKNRHTTKTKHNPEKANNAKHSKTKLAWFSHLLRHSARTEVDLYYNVPKPHEACYLSVSQCPVNSSSVEYDIMIKQLP